MPGGTAWDGQSVIAWQVQCVLQQIVELVTKPAVTAIDGRRADAMGIKPDRTFVE